MDRTTLESEPYNTVRGLIRGRRQRDAIFDDELFANPAWDIFLALYEAELLHERLATKQLCKAAALPMATALRWIDKLEKLRWIKRQTDPEDRRRKFVELTDRGLEAMQKYFSIARLNEL